MGKIIKERSCGIVVFDNDKVLLIKHNKGHISFPKGHVEVGESDEETAYREVLEETGIEAKIISNDRFINTYKPKTGYLKDVILYAGIKVGGNLKPQEEEVSMCDFYDYDIAYNMVTYDVDKKILEETIKIYNEYKKEINK